MSDAPAAKKRLSHEGTKDTKVFFRRFAPFLLEPHFSDGRGNGDILRDLRVFMVQTFSSDCPNADRVLQ